jgi:DNA-binding protein HU-beta
MNKSDIVDKIQEDAQITKGAAERAVKSFVDSITSALKKGESVALIGFGTFKVSKRAARSGRNPKTGAVLQIAERNSPVFTAGKTLKDAVNQ